MALGFRGNLIFADQIQRKKSKQKGKKKILDIWIKIISFSDQLFWLLLCDEITHIRAMQPPIAFGMGESPESSDACCTYSLGSGVNCRTKGVWNVWKTVFALTAVSWLTNLSRKVFSLSAPMQPAKPRMNMTPPTTMKSHTGSKPPRSVMDDRLDSTPWGKRRKTKVSG